MAARTTTKVAVQTGAAKDDLLTGLNEDALSMSFNVLANDPGSAKLYSLLQAPDLSAPNAQFPVVTTALSAHGATLTMTSDGMVAYDASSMSASLQQTAAGETFNDTFTYTIRMANGALSTATATVEIAGVNDAPTLTLTGTGIYTITDTAADDTPSAITVSLTGNDVDNGAILTYSTSGASDYGTLVAGEVAGTYDFIADAAKIDELDADDAAQAVFSVIVTDENGAASAPVMLTFDLVGANDTAEISGVKTGAVTEDGTLAAAGSLTITDRDHDQSSFQVPADLVGDYGSFTFTSDGAWTYALDNAATNVQALAGGATVVDTLDVKSFDGLTTETITVTVTGAIDETTVTVTGGPTPSPVTTFMVNNGLSFVNNRTTINGFDANDLLNPANNYDYVSFSVTDTNNDSVVDATEVTFEFTFGQNSNLITVVLVGYTAFTEAQVV